MHALVGVLIISLWLQAFKFVLHEVTCKKAGQFLFLGVKNATLIMFCILSKVYMISSLNKIDHTHTMHHDHSMVYLATHTLHTSLKTVQNVLFWLYHSTCMCNSISHDS